MSTYKIEYIAGQKNIVIQGQKGQQISEREYYAISNGLVPGLLRGELIRKGNTFRLNYNVSGFVSLRDFLVKPLNKASFAKLLGNILSNLKALQNSYYNHQFILMDMNAAMVNPATQQVNFVYVPITFYESGTSLKEFLLSIIQCCSFIPGENTDYIRDYIKILNSGINFSVFDLEEYIKSLKIDGRITDNEKKCTRCGSVIQHNMNFCSSCGMKVSISSINTSQGVYDPAKTIIDSRKLDGDDKHTSLDSKSKFSQTISVGHDHELPLPVSHQSKTVIICRLKTGEQFKVTSDTFKIGKGPNNCDYCVSGNSAISRCHALIKNVNGKWFINDLNSTNSTFIGAKKLHPHEDVELVDGTKFKLADENFVFNLF